MYVFDRHYQTLMYRDKAAAILSHHPGDVPNPTGHTLGIKGAPIFLTDSGELLGLITAVNTSITSVFDYPGKNPPKYELRYLPLEEIENNNSRNTVWFKVLWDGQPGLVRGLPHTPTAVGIEKLHILTSLMHLNFHVVPSFYDDGNAGTVQQGIDIVYGDGVHVGEIIDRLVLLNGRPAVLAKDESITVVDSDDNKTAHTFMLLKCKAERYLNIINLDFDAEPVFHPTYYYYPVVDIKTRFGFTPSEFIDTYKT